MSTTIGTPAAACDRSVGAADALTMTLVLLDDDATGEEEVIEPDS